MVSSVPASLVDRGRSPGFDLLCCGEEQLELIPRCLHCGIVEVGVPVGLVEPLTLRLREVLDAPSPLEGVEVSIPLRKFRKDSQARALIEMGLVVSIPLRKFRKGPEDDLQRHVAAGFHPSKEV